MLEELHHSEEAHVMRSAGRFQSQRPSSQFTLCRSSKAICPICKQAGRKSYNHFLSKCLFLPESDQCFLTRAHLIAAIEEEDQFISEQQVTDAAVVSTDSNMPTVTHSIEVHNQLEASVSRRVQITQSPYINVFYQHYPVKVVIDSGAETNMIRESVARQIGIPMSSSSQLALQADGHSSLEVVGETRITLTRDKHSFLLEALVVSNLDSDILAGVPFMIQNDISVRPSKKQVQIGDDTFVSYSTQPKTSNTHTIRSCMAHILHAPVKTTIWPGEFIEVDTPSELPVDAEVAIEPRCESSYSSTWLKPSILSSVDGKVRIPNHTSSPIVIKKNDHFGQLSEVFSPETSPAAVEIPSVSCVKSNYVSKATCHSTSVCLNPDSILPARIYTEFEFLHAHCDIVFDPNFPGYNASAGDFKAVVNMGPVQPPQCKGRLPQYSRSKLTELQEHFDCLEVLGVFKCPEEIGVVVEYLSPSFLVKKPSGGHCLVTSFTEVAKYTKSQPSLMPDVDSTLRQLANWKYLITTDLTSAFYQIPLDKESMKYCGVATPFKGVRVYTRTAMGMPGSETAPEELLSRVFGDLIQEGVVAKLADDLYCGGNTPEDLLINWDRLLSALFHNGLRLSAPKTVIAPKSTTILGWIWSQGTIKASPHHTSALSTCDPPSTVKGLRSFIGAVKVIA